jgi:hypothetical protein
MEIIMKYYIGLTFNDVDDFFRLNEAGENDSFYTDDRDFAIERAEGVFEDFQRQNIKDLKVSVIITKISAEGSEVIKVFKNY